MRILNAPLQRGLLALKPWLLSARQSETFPPSQNPAPGISAIQSEPPSPLSSGSEPRAYASGNISRRIRLLVTGLLMLLLLWALWHFQAPMAPNAGIGIAVL